MTDDNIGPSWHNPKVLLSPRAMNVGSAPRTGVASAVSITLLYVNILIATCYYSQIVKFFGGNIFEWVNRSMYVFGGASLVIGLILGEITACVLSMALMSYFFIMVYVGISYGPSEYINSIFLPYVPLTITPIISFLLKNKREKVIVKSVIYVSIFYFLLYDYFSLTLRPEDFTRSGGGFISASGDRAARIALEPAITCLGYYLGLSGLRRGHNVKLSLFVLLISVLAIFLSQSRGLTATILSISLMYAFFPNKRLAYSISLWVFLSSTVIMVVLFALNINIYGLGPDDLSLYARMHELQTIIQGFGDYPIFGRGFYNPIPTDKNIYVDYNTAVFWNDMGVYGILWAAGSVGLVLFVGLSVAIMRSNTLIVDIGLSPILADAMLLSFATCGAQGFTAPIFWTSGITLVTFYLAFVSTRLTIHRIRDRIA